MKLRDTRRLGSNCTSLHILYPDTLVYICYTLALSFIFFVTIQKYYDANARMSHVPGSDLVLNMAKGIF